MNDIAGILVCSGFVVTVLLFFGFIIGMRYLNYKETMSLAEKGLVKPPAQNSNGKGTLRWGIAIASIGVALTLGLATLGINTSYPLGLGPWMVGGYLPLFFGLGLVLIYVLSSNGKAEVKSETRQEVQPVKFEQVNPVEPEESSKPENQ